MSRRCFVAPRAAPLDGSPSSVDASLAQTAWQLRAWRIGTWKETIVFGFEGYASLQSISVDGSRALTKSYHPTHKKAFTVWDLTKKRAIVTLAEKKSFVVAAVLSADGRTVVHGGTDGVVRFFDVARAEHVARVPGKGWLDVATRSDDGRFFATGGRAGVVHVWHANATKLRTLRVGARIEGLAFSPDGETLVAHSAKGAPIAWDVSSAAFSSRLTHTVRTDSSAACGACDSHKTAHAS